MLSYLTRSVSDQNLGARARAPRNPLTLRLIDLLTLISRKLIWVRANKYRLKGIWNTLRMLYIYIVILLLLPEINALALGTISRRKM